MWTYGLPLNNRARFVAVSIGGFVIKPPSPTTSKQYCMLVDMITKTNLILALGPTEQIHSPISGSGSISVYLRASLIRIVNAFHALDVRVDHGLRVEVGNALDVVGIRGHGRRRWVV